MLLLVTQLCPTLRSHGLQLTRLLCPSLSPVVCSDSCPSSWWCYLTISFPSPFAFDLSQPQQHQFLCSVLCPRYSQWCSEWHKTSQEPVSFKVKDKLYHSHSTLKAMDPRIQSRHGWQDSSGEGVNFKPNRRLKRWRFLDWNAFGAEGHTITSRCPELMWKDPAKFPSPDWKFQDSAGTHE